MGRVAIVLVMAASAAALAACSPSASPPSPSPSPTPMGMSFEELRQANADYVDCVEALGATVTVNQIDDFGVPDISNDTQWPKVPGEPGDEDYEAAIEQIMEWDNDCSSTTIDPARQAYWASGNKSALKQANLDKRWEQMLPQVRECFTKAGAYTDQNTGRDELMRIFNSTDDNVAYTQCLADARLVTDLGGGSYQIDS